MNLAKTNVTQLAAMGGAPLFDEPVHVGRPNLGDRGRLLARINEMLDRRWLSNNGPFVQEFEAKLEAFLGVRHCIAMCNGTIALEIAIRAAGLRGEVIVPSFTFVATAHALQWQEITPVFCDIDPRTHLIDPAQVQRLITPRTTGIVGVHTWGQPCDVEALAQIAHRRNLTLMFDAAHAFGCSYRGKMIGNFGAAEVFSFHATKFFNTFEGGAIVTNDGALAAKIRLMKNFGFHGYDNVEYIGINGKMTEVAAAMGLTGLESLDDFVAHNRRNYNRYWEELAGVPGVRMLPFNRAERCNFQYIVIEVEEAGDGDRARQHRPGAARREHSRAPLFLSRLPSHGALPVVFPHAGLLLPETERLAQRIVVLPTGTAIGEEEISGICGVLRLLTAHGQEVRELMASRDRAPVGA